MQKPTHRKFDEDYDDSIGDDDDREEMETVDDKVEVIEEVHEDEDDDAPEVVSSSSLDVQRLRELHDKLGSVVGKGKKNKRLKPKSNNGDTERDKRSNIDADVGLDMSVLENLDADIDELNQELEQQERDGCGSDEESYGEDETDGRFKIDTTSRSMRIGNTEVTMLGSRDQLDSYKISDKALEFEKSVVDAYERKELGGFVKNRKKRKK